ncbi:glucuronate isomerase [Paenibacillus sp. J5C_2022]|nr:glucuronate isomerase [Paenibacillus sp. J5C2022]
MSKVMELPVLDTHTHLIGDSLAARDFWQIAHYFWLLRELQAGGYPADAEKLPLDERIEAFVAAYDETRTTLMNIAFTRIMSELYGVAIHDGDSVRRAIAVVEAAQADAGWAQTVADRMAIRRSVVNYPQHGPFQGMREDAVVMPRIDGEMGKWLAAVEASEDPGGIYRETVSVIDRLLREYADRGYPGVMTTLPHYGVSAKERRTVGPGSSRDVVMMEFLHEVCAAAERHGLLVQLFLGVERSWCGEATPVNDPQRILKLLPLFEVYSCPFELVLASELNNLDAVQAAWNFPNVHIGGMWWFNFRASTYKDSMQYRLEALPASKCSLVVSDARCIEWSYGKIWLIKRLAADFLWERLTQGWIDEGTALRTAEQWLYGSAMKRYHLIR